MNICCSDNEPNHEDSQGMIEKHDSIVSRSCDAKGVSARGKATPTIDEQR